MRKGSTLYFLAQDHLGGTALVMNSTGGVVSRMGYYPYGMTWTEQGVTPTDKLYTGQQRLGAKSGIYNYASRFYSADIGRFPQPDSILPNVFEPQALSRYTYVRNNPTNFTDPTGHFGGGSYPVGPIPGGGGDPVESPGNDNGNPTRPPQDTPPEWDWWRCSISSGHPYHGVQLELKSKFYFNYRTLVQDPPQVIPTPSGNAEWRNVNAYNSPWGSSGTVRFADAWGTEQAKLGDDAPYIPGLTIWYFHLWIQEDAWGNCDFHSHIDPSFEGLWPF